MPTFVRGEATAPEVIDRWDDGFGWIAHPEEETRRAGHAVRGDDGVWILDPLDAPGVTELVADLGEVAGVAVCSNYHARDAAVFARRFDVPVSVPRWTTRIAERIDAPVERYDDRLGESGFRVENCTPLPGWREGIAYREADGTLYVPDVIGTASTFTAGDERLGVHTFVRPFGLASPLADVDPERILVGHGSGVLEEAAAALSDARSGARRRFPRALYENASSQIRSLLGALLTREF